MDQPNQDFNYGGQAVIEGVMMRGGTHMAVAVRDPEGDIVIREEEVDSPLYNGALSKIPFVRGLGLLWDSLGLGTRALFWSADVAIPEEERDEDGETMLDSAVGVGAVAVPLMIMLAVFFLFPAFVTDMLHRFTPLESSLLGNFIERMIHLSLVILYIVAIGQIPEIRRVFQYHGAEHKTINAYEAGAPLTPASVNTFPLEHPRCGTGFLLVIVFVSFVIFSLMGRPPLWLRLVTRVVFVPVIAGIAYEYIRWTARHMHLGIVKLLVQPQLLLQKLTTRQPTADMLEVSIVALERVLAAEKQRVKETSLESVPANAK
ncbi:MAG: DUF1385 domain-containing protein [Chloroflexi bacterium]|nr:DUF1385 domain-containing protein [Chloroflexota bacterium]